MRSREGVDALAQPASHGYDYSREGPVVLQPVGQECGVIVRRCKDEGLDWSAMLWSSSPSLRRRA